MRYRQTFGKNQDLPKGHCFWCGKKWDEIVGYSTFKNGEKLRPICGKCHRDKVGRWETREYFAKMGWGVADVKKASQIF